MAIYRADARIKTGFRYIQGHNLFREYQRIRQRCEAIAPSLQIYRLPPPPPPAPTFSAQRFVANPASNWRAAPPPTYNRPAPLLANWRATPCWKPVRALSNMELLPDIIAGENQHSKRERKLVLALGADDVAKLRSQ